MNPVVSVVMPVYNVEDYISESLECLLNQTFSDFEIICIDDGSTDNSVSIIEKYMEKDSRIILLHQQNKGAGAARNKGTEAAKGTYIIYLDSDDRFHSRLLEKAVSLAKEEMADIVVFDYYKFEADESKNHFRSLMLNHLPVSFHHFSWEDCPDHIMTVINPTPWNKLYSADFIKEHHFRFDEISSTNDIAFAAVTAAAAKRIAYVPRELVGYRIGHSGSITSTKRKNINNVLFAVKSGVRQALSLPYANKIETSIALFAVKNLVVALCRYVTDFHDEQVRVFFNEVKEYLSQPLFDHILDADVLTDKESIAFRVIRECTYEHICDHYFRRVIVSLTSWPKRIHCVRRSLDTILQQTRPADKIILWLSLQQFPDREIPEDLMELVNEGKLDVEWVEDDYKPHKKYFYAMQQYPDDIIVTIDDDLIYEPTLIENLLSSYLLFPHCVSAMRAHLIVFNNDGSPASYKEWMQEVSYGISSPSMQLCATGGAGCLYPPHLLHRHVFDTDAIIHCCLRADDLWMKANEALCDVPVVLAPGRKNCRYVPDSQDVGLVHFNAGQNNENDEQFKAITEWADRLLGQGVLNKKLQTVLPGMPRHPFLTVENVHFFYARFAPSRKAAAATPPSPGSAQTSSRIEHPTSYAIGLAITCVPRKIRSCVHLIQSEGLQEAIKYTLGKLHLAK